MLSLLKKLYSIYIDEKAVLLSRLTPKATYLQRAVKGATPWRSVRLQAEFPFVKAWGVRRTKQMAELLFNIEYHKAYYDTFPLKLY